MKKFIILLILGFTAMGAVILMQKDRQSSGKVTNRISVVTSFYPLYFFAREIVGDKANVVNITPAGAEPHDYELSTRDLADIEQADALVVNGDMEPWVDEVTQNLKGKDVKVIVAGSSLMNLTEIEEGETHADPHIWLDPVKAKGLANAIADGLKAADPENGSFYEMRKIALEEKLDALDELYREGLTSCRIRDFVTSHSAFSYLATRYNLSQVPITGLSPEDEPSAKQLAVVAKFSKDNGVKYIFFETLVSPKLSETIANEVGAKTLVLDPIEGVSDDDSAAGKNYFSLMRENLENLQTALECKP